MRYVLLLLLIFFASMSGVQGQTLRFGLSNVTAPYAFADKDGNVIGGISYDLAALVARKLNAKLKIVVSSRNRLELDLRSGELDFICRTSKTWLKNPEELFWSGPLFEKQDIIVGLAHSPVIKSTKGLRGKTLGAVTGYIYPKLEGAFGTGQIRREDALDEDRLLRKLILARSDYAVVDSIVYQYYLKQNSAAALFNEPVFSLERDMTECAMSRLAPYTAQQFHGVFNEIRDKKLLEPILQKYR